MIIVLQGFALGSLYGWTNGPGADGGGGGAVTDAAAIRGKLIHPILTHWTNITTSWWWVACLAALGVR